MPHTFRQAATEDIPVIRALAVRIWEEAYSEILSKEQIGYMLDMMYSEEVLNEEISNGVVWDIISDNGEPCGYLSYSSDEEHSVKLSKIYIEKTSRGKGIAGEAIGRVVRHGAINGKDCIFLTVNKNNKMAIRAYEKNGFTITDAVIADIGNGFVMDDYIMKYFLKP
jgi:RimJ/RimL family protein N-acetyltransferase